MPRARPIVAAAGQPRARRGNRFLVALDPDLLAHRGRNCSANSCADGFAERVWTCVISVGWVAALPGVIVTARTTK